MTNISSKSSQHDFFTRFPWLPYKYPRDILFLDELPKTGTGKIDRQALIRTLAASEAAGSDG